MPGLKFIIDGDDSPLRKKLAALAKDAGNGKYTGGSAAKIQADQVNGVEQEVSARKKNIKAINDEASAIQTKNKEALATPKKTTEVSDSSAEVAAYQASRDTVAGLSNGAAVVDKFNVELGELAAQQTVLNTQFENGAITQDVYLEASRENAVAQNNLRTEIDRVNAAFTELTAAERAAIAASNSNSGAAHEQSTAIAEEIGLLENAIAVKKELIANRVGIVDEAALARENRLLQEYEAEIVRLSNIGKVGFDSQGIAIRQVSSETDVLGRAVSRATNFSAIGARVVTQLSRQIIGLSVGLLSFTIGAKAIEALVAWISNLDLFTGRLDQAKHNMEAFNEVSKQMNELASPQISNLKILYKVATDEAESTRDRTDAARELKKEFPDAFANSKISAILNGEESKSFKQLTQDILDNARARASADKIAKISDQVLDQDFQIAKNNAAKAQALSRVKGPIQANQYNQNYGGYGSMAQPISEDEQRKDIINRTNRNNLVPYQNKAVLQGQIDFLLQVAGGASKVAKAIEGGNNLIKDPLKKFDEIIKNASQASDLDVLKNSLEAKLKALAPGDKDIKLYADKIRQVEKLQKQYSPKVNDGKAQENAEAESAKRRIELLNQVADAVENVNRKSVNSDQQALTEVSDKFDQLRKKVEAFNRDPKNKNHQVGTDYIDKDGKKQNTYLDSLNAKENTNIDNQANLNENKYIQDDIEKKKKLYSDYEDFKIKAGSKAADAEYQDLLKSGKDFYAYLSTLDKGIDSNDQSGPIQERRVLVKKALDDNLQDQKNSLENLLIENVSYEERRKTIVQAGIESEKKLRDAGYGDRALQVSKNIQDQLTALDEEKFKTLDSYKSLFANIDQLSDDAAKKQIGNLQAYAAIQLAMGKITVEAYIEITKGLSKANTAVDSRLPNKLKDVGNLFSEISSSVSGLNANLGKAIGNLGTIIKSVGDLKQGFTTLNDSSASSADKFSAGLGVAGTFVGLFTKLLIDPVNEAAEKVRAAQAYNAKLQIDATTAVNKALERQLALTKDLYGPERISGYIKELNDLNNAQKTNNSLLATGAAGGKAKYGVAQNVSSIDPTTVKALEEYNNGQFTFIDIQKLKDLGVFVDLSKQSIEQLQQLLDSGKIDSATATLVQNQIALQDQITDTTNALHAELLGQDFSDIEDSIVSLFQNATASTEDFSDNFQKIMQKAILNSFKRDALEKQLQGFYDDFYNYSASGDALSQDEIAKLKAEYDKVIADAQKQFDQLKEATGVDLTDGSADSSSALNKSIQGITSDQANALEGIQRGQYDYTKKIYELQLSGNSQLSQQAANIAAGLRNWQAIEFNTAQTVVRLDSAIVELQKGNAALASIVTNTKGTSLRGGGLV